MTSVQFSVRFCKNCRFRFSFGFTKLTAVSSFLVRLGLHSSVNISAIFYLRLYGMTLEMTYFRAELVQIIVSQSDSELEVQRYGRKKNTLTVNPIMLQDELWMRQHEKPSPNRQSRFLKTELRKPSFRFLKFEVGSVFRKPISDIFIGFRTPLPIFTVFGLQFSLNILKKRFLTRATRVACVWMHVRQLAVLCSFEHTGEK